MTYRTIRQESVAVSIVALFLTAVITGGIVAITWAVRAEKCETRAELMQLDHQWGPIKGCMVRVGSRFAPIEYIRIVDEKVIIQGDGE